MKNTFMRVNEVADELGVSKPCAYKLVQKLNGELKSKNFITISGRISRQYFQERVYGLKPKDRKGASENAGI